MRAIEKRLERIEERRARIEKRLDAINRKIKRKAKYAEWYEQLEREAEQEVCND